jgi:CRISPR-associated protein Cas1
MHTLAITEQGTQVHVEGETLLLSRERQVLRRVRLAEVNQVLLFGRVEVSSAAIAILARRQVDVIFLTQQGYFRARLTGPASAQAALRLAQLRCALDPAFCLRVTKTRVAGKIIHQRQLLLRAQRRLRDEDLAEVLGRLRVLAEQCEQSPDLDHLRGLEGAAAALYFSQLGKLIRVPAFAFRQRTRRPPRDPVNACLSFGYVMLGTVVETEVLRCGLEPMVGFFHQPFHGRPSLVLDVVEEFRPLVDALVLRLINRRQLGPLDFERRGGASLEEILAETPSDGETAPAHREAALPRDGSAGAAGEPAGGTAVPVEEAGEGVYLAGTGRKVFLTEFFRRLRERLYYPPRQGTYELRDIVREQIYHLARVIEGKEGEYRPFVPT